MKTMMNTELKYTRHVLRRLARYAAGCHSFSQTFALAMGKHFAVQSKRRYPDVSLQVVLDNLQLILDHPVGEVLHDRQCAIFSVEEPTAPWVYGYHTARPDQLSDIVVLVLQSSTADFGNDDAAALAEEIRNLAPEHVGQVTLAVVGLDATTRDYTGLSLRVTVYPER